MKSMLKTIVLGYSLAAASVGAASAQNLLDDIIKRGTINIGVSLGTPPYGLTNEKMEPDGYDVELARLIGRDLGVKVNIVDTIASNRIPNLTSNKLDLVISSFSITAERAKAIAFTNTVYVDQQVLLAPKDNKFASLADLKGKKIGVTRSTTNDIALTKRAVEGTNIQRYDDDASTSQALLAGQVDGIVTSGGLAQVFSQKSPNLESKFPVASAPMGLGLRRGDPTPALAQHGDLHVVDDRRDPDAAEEVDGRRGAGTAPVLTKQGTSPRGPLPPTLRWEGGLPTELRPGSSRTPARARRLSAWPEPRSITRNATPARSKAHHEDHRC